MLNQPSGPGSGPRPTGVGTRVSMPVVGIAASAGGPRALATILPSIAGLAAPVLIVQHLDPRAIDDFHDWMARVSPLPVEIPEDGLLLRPGAVYIAPPRIHLKLGFGRRLVLDTQPDRPYRPSADELFLSMASRAGPQGIGVILTGMGDDGAVGLRALHRAGGTTVVQDRNSSAVYGMPSAAESLDPADHVRPLVRIAAAIQQAVKVRTR